MDESTRQMARTLIIRHEGFRPHVYKDSRGFLTLGIGHCLVTSPITMQAASAILDDDLNDAMWALQNHIIDFNSLIRARQVVLIDMVFNLGITGLLKFEKMWEAIRTSNWNAAADAMLDSKWAAEVGSRAKEDAQIMRSGYIDTSSS